MPRHFESKRQPTSHSSPTRTERPPTSRKSCRKTARRLARAAAPHSFRQPSVGAHSSTESECEPREQGGSDNSNDNQQDSDYLDWQSTGSEEAENERIESSMGVIRKKTAARGTDGGTKYHCDVCSVDVTSTVRISCADPACPEYDLCVPCFGKGEATKNHDPRTHRFHVVEQNSFPIYDEEWGADEELLLLEGAEIYGLGSWADIADHIGGYRTKDEVRDHYIDTYVNSSKFPLPELADPKDRTLSERIPKDEFQARKKRRIEDRKEAAKHLPPATPKQKPTASVPSCHEIQGYMPGRLEFETEFANEAEEAVQHMQFEPGDGLDANGQMDEETALKMTIFDIYNTRLGTRVERKKVIFEHNLLEYRKNAALDKKRTKDERELLNKAKPFARMMNHDDFEAFTKDLLYEHNLRLAISQLQEWKQMGIPDLKHGEKYEAEKQARAARAVPQGQFDRLGFSIRNKPGSKNQEIEGPSEANKFTAPELPHRFQKKPPTSDANASKAQEQPAMLNDFDKLFAETDNSIMDHTGLTPPPPSSSAPPSKTKYTVPPLTGSTPWNLESDETLASDLQLLSAEETQLCNVCHLRPKAYLVLKEALIKEAMKQGGNLRRKDVRAMCKIDVNKANRLHDFMVHSGWIGKG
ncbi:putative saga complex subunit [Phaeomoniella chlamydospora]|uniref:Transcriptional adapter 2 n=1 Tax=Phaeomoniella chlamydospora TaxID=158046 RepID=A0A0G2EDG0_PHACM|nr:putative saga complex subunit [Phaeomoniella chlamydospora]